MNPLDPEAWVSTRRRMMRRLGGSALAAPFLLAPASRAKPLEPSAERVRAAVLYGFPVYTMALTRDRAIAREARQGSPALNRLRHRAGLATAEDRVVTTPNNDTLYSAAWLDLSDGPVTITWPATERYHSIALLSPFTDNVAVFGSRDGPGGGRLLVAGPGWRGQAPSGHRLVRAPAADMWCIVRVLVNGPDDLAAARALQQQVVLVAPSTPSAAPAGLADQPDPAMFLDAVNAMLGRMELRGERAARAGSLAAVGIAPGQRGAFQRLPAALQAEWARTLPALVASLKNGFAETGIVREGWSYPKPGMGRFGADDLYRSRVALGGLAALPADEAVYLTGVADAEGAALSGDRVYRLRIPARIPIAAGGFWSLSMYELLPDGRQFFTANARNRYAIGDRTPGLIRNADGSLDVIIAHRAPDAPGNWLPAPEGPFRVSFRLYRPLPEAQDGRWRFAPLRRVAS